jgi:ADP-glucose pyrophosphorylase
MKLLLQYYILKIDEMIERGELTDHELKDLTITLDMLVKYMTKIKTIRKYLQTHYDL